MRFFIFFVILSALMTGCSTVNSYHSPNPNTELTATVSGSSERHGMFDWSANAVSTIDDKAVGLLWSNTTKIYVTPGPHRYVIQTEFNQSFGSGGPYTGITEVSFSAAPGQAYRFISKPEGASILVWAVDSHGQRVSPVGSSQYTVAPRTIYY